MAEHATRVGGCAAPRGRHAELHSRAGREGPGPADPVFPTLGLEVGERRVRVIRCPIHGRHPDRPCPGCGGSGEIVHEWERVSEYEYQVTPGEVQMELAAQDGTQVEGVQK